MKKEIKNYFETPNFRQIRVKYVGPTNYKGARICIFEPQRWSDDTTKRIYLSYDYSVGNVEQQAFEALTKAGFNVICRSSDVNSYIFLCDNWSENFIEVTEIKK